MLVTVILMTCDRQPAVASREITASTIHTLMVFICLYFISFLLFLLNDPGAQHCAVAVVVQLKWKNEDAPIPAVFFPGQIRQAVKASVDVSLARTGDGCYNDLPFSSSVPKIPHPMLSHQH